MKFATLSCILAVLLSSATAYAEERFSAHETLQRAGVGTYSENETAPATERRKPAQQTFQRVDCRVDYSRPLQRSVICDLKD